MSASKMAVIQTHAEASANYRRLIRAIVDAGFRISSHTNPDVSSTAMDYNILPIEVESAFDLSGRHVFTVAYKPVENVFYITSAKDTSLVLGEIQRVPHDDAKLADYFDRLRNLLFPTTSLYITKNLTTKEPV